MCSSLIHAERTRYRRCPRRPGPSRNPYKPRSSYPSGRARSDQETSVFARLASEAIGWAIQRRIRRVRRVVAQVTSSVGHASELARVERLLIVEVELEAHEPELEQVVQLEDPVLQDVQE